MHIITGMLVAGILGRKRGASLLPRLRTGPVQTAHAMPGRVRLRIPMLVDQPARAVDLTDRLGGIEGVEQVAFSPTTGSLLIRYRENQVRPELLFAATVRLLGLENEILRTPRPAVVRELRSMMGSLNRAVYERTGGLLDFSSALLILLAAVGLRKIAQQGAAALPTGFTLVWWGAHHLLGRGEE